MYPGNCWAFRGSQGYLVVRLSMKIRPTGVALEHIPKALSPTGNISSAPKDFAVYVSGRSAVRGVWGVLGAQGGLPPLALQASRLLVEGTVASSPRGGPRVGCVNQAGRAPAASLGSAWTGGSDSRTGPSFQKRTRGLERDTQNPNPRQVTIDVVAFFGLFFPLKK